MNYRTQGLFLFALICIPSLAGAHDPDEPVLEVPEIAVVGERPIAASSQQFIPDKEIILQPQGRPAQILRLIPGMLAVEHSLISPFTWGKSRAVPMRT